MRTGWKLSPSGFTFRSRDRTRVIFVGEKDHCEHESIEKLLERYRPSELDDAVKSVCPFFERDDPELTSVYLEFHELVKAGLLTELQLKLDEMQVVSEKEVESGRVDGSVYEPSVNGGRVLLQNEGNTSVCLADIEVKTGRSVKILQLAAYTFLSKTPVVLAEVPKEKVHLLDRETGLELLRFARRQIERIDRLGEGGRYIPDGYRCGSCGNSSCPYHKSGGIPEVRGLIQKRTSELIGKNGKVVGRIVDCIEDLSREKGFKVETESREVPVLEA